MHGRGMAPDASKGANVLRVANCKLVALYLCTRRKLKFLRISTATATDRLLDTVETDGRPTIPTTSVAINISISEFSTGWGTLPFISTCIACILSLLMQNTLLETVASLF